MLTSRFPHNALHASVLTATATRVSEYRGNPGYPTAEASSLTFSLEDASATRNEILTDYWDYEYKG